MDHNPLRPNLPTSPQTPETAPAPLRLLPPRYPPAPPATSEGGDPPPPPGNPEWLISAFGACLLDITLLHAAMLVTDQAESAESASDDMARLAAQTRMSLRRRLAGLRSSIPRAAERLLGLDLRAFQREILFLSRWGIPLHELEALAQQGFTAAAPGRDEPEFYFFPLAVGDRPETLSPYLFARRLLDHLLDVVEDRPGYEGGEVRRTPVFRAFLAVLYACYAASRPADGEGPEAEPQAGSTPARREPRTAGLRLVPPAGPPAPPGTSEGGRPSGRSPDPETGLLNALLESFNDMAMVRTTLETLELFRDDEDLRSEMRQLVAEAHGNLEHRFRRLRDGLHAGDTTALRIDLEELKARVMRMVREGELRHQLGMLMNDDVFETSAKRAGNPPNTPYHYEFRQPISPEELDRLPPYSFACLLLEDILSEVADEASYADQAAFDRRIWQKLIALAFVCFCTTDPMFYGTEGREE